MKIVMLASSPDPQRRGGTSGHVLNLADWLRQFEGVSVTLISFGEHKSVTGSGAFRHVTLTSKTWHKFMPIIPITKVAKVVARERPDVIHVQGSTLGYMLLYAFFVAPRSLPKVVTVHGHPIEEGLVSGWLKRGSLKHRMMVWSERRIPRHFDVIVTGTSSIRDEVMRNCSTNALAEVQVILNGVDEVQYSGEVACDAIPQLRLSSKPKGLTLLNAKALTEFNGQEVLIRAFVSVLARVGNSRLLLAGEGADRERLMSLCTDLGVTESVHFLGRVPNSLMPGLISVADVVVVPSRRIGGVEEGSSILLVEAMASRTPVVASDVGGLSETVVDGETGVLVPENNPHRLAAAILWLHENPEKASAIAERARDYVIRERTWRIVSEKYLAVYKFVVGERQHPK